MAITCSSCGSKVPFTGNVCPKCHADKGHDKASHVVFTIIGIPLFIVGVLIAGIVGGLIGIVLAAVLNFKLLGAPPQRQPAPARDAPDRNA